MHAPYLGIMGVTLLSFTDFALLRKKIDPDYNLIVYNVLKGHT